MARKRAAKEEAAQPTGPEMAAEERAELDARLTRMFSKPHKSGTPDNFFLLWMQLDENDKPTMMMWHPETEAEIRGANFFHDAAHGLGAFAKPVAKGKAVRRSATEAALVKSILQNREDHTGYLVYADYLTENGNTQGDFIRLCVELESLKPGDANYDQKNERLGELIDAHAEEWYGPLGELGLRPEFYGSFTPWLWLSTERGVIEEVAIDRPGLLPGNADRLFAAAPFLRKLEFEKGQVDPGLAKVKHLQQIEDLEFSHSDLTAEVLTAILRSKYLTNLKTLLLNGNDIGPAGATVLAAWPGLARLETLDLTSCDLRVEGVVAIANCKHTANLTRLRLGSNTNDADAGQAILESPHLKKLTELDLSGMEFTPVTAAHFRTAAFAKTLQRLDLESVTFHPGAFAEFTGSSLPALRSLRLNSVNLRLPAASLLANAKFTGTLEVLELDNCQLGGGVANMVHQARFPKLTTLDLSRNRIQNSGGIALAGAANKFPALTSLKLWDNRLGPDAITTLAKSKLFENLTDLDINDNKIGPAGALALAKSNGLKKLTSLTVDEKTVGKKGKQALLDRFGEVVISWR